jgi:hypothetical protein
MELELPEADLVDAIISQKALYICSQAILQLRHRYVSINELKYRK